MNTTKIFRIANFKIYLALLILHLPSPAGGMDGAGAIAYGSNLHHSKLTIAIISYIKILATKITTNSSQNTLINLALLILHLPFPAGYGAGAAADAPVAGGGGRAGGVALAGAAISITNHGVKTLDK